MNTKTFLCLAFAAIVGTMHATPTLSPDELAKMHRSFAKSGNFEEMLRAIEKGKHIDAFRPVRERDLAILHEHFSTVQDKQHMTEEQREIYANRLRANLADLERRGITPPDLEHELSVILDDNSTPSPMSSFFNENGGNIGMGIYHGVDGMFNRSQANKFSKGLKGTTPSDVWHGVNNNTSSMGHVLAGIRNTTQGIYGLMPFLNKLPLIQDSDENDASAHSATSKALGAAHLGARAATLAMHLATRKNHKLTAQEAKLLAYYNRRYGTPDSIRNLHRLRKRLNNARLALRVLGQAALPALFAFGYNADKSGKSYTSPGLAIANTSGIIDALLGMYDRHKTNQAMKQVRKILPLAGKALELKPATEHERALDREAAEMTEPAPELPSLM